MSKYLKYTTCPICQVTITKQSLKQHLRKHEKVPKNQCLNCGTPTESKFCCRSCSATYNNTKRGKKQRINLRKELNFQKYISGLVTDRNVLRKRISEERGYTCEICSTSEWMDKPLTLVVDHINGDASNNHPNNVRLICPNCNSQTETFGGRNKGNGRKARGLSLN